jgi:uncharacterized membrane protein YfhO
MNEGFSVTVDGKEVKPVRVNTAFLGFPVKSSSHKVEIRFKAPLLAIGKAVSVFGIIMLIMCLGLDIAGGRKKADISHKT